MRKAFFAPAIVVLVLAATAVPMFAHHSWPVDMSKLVTVKGTVSEIAWENPHPMFTLNVKAPDGAIQKWQLGGPATNRMEANGWTKTTIKPGDVITGTGYQFSDGQKILRLEKVTLPSGKDINVYGR